jgi:nucleoside-diphosphate-sugar epimerase
VLPETPDKINETNDFIWKVFSGQDAFSDKTIPSNAVGLAAHVDVRDVARVTLFGVEHSDVAKNQRYLLSGGWGTTQAAADILRRAYPERRHIIKEGNPGGNYLPDFSYPDGAPKLNTSKAVRETGQDWIGFEKTVLDAAKAFEAYL